MTTQTQSPFDPFEPTIIGPPTLEILLQIKPTNLGGTQGSIARVIDPARPDRIIKIWSLGKLTPDNTNPFLNVVYTESDIDSREGIVFVGDEMYQLDSPTRIRVHGAANEIAVLAKISQDQSEGITGSRYFPHLYDHGLALSETGNLVAYLEMQEIKGKTLEYILTRLKSPQYQLRNDLRHNLIQRVAYGLGVVSKYLVKNNIEHGDIKPSNIIITENSLSVVDAGCSLGIDLGTHLPEYFRINDLHARLKAGTISDIPIIFGTPVYMSLQQASGGFDPTGNIYASTIILAETIIGHHPFNCNYHFQDLITYNQNASDLPERVMTQIEQSPIWPLIYHTSRDVESIVYYGLSRVSSDRFAVPKLMCEWARKI